MERLNAPDQDALVPRPVAIMCLTLPAQAVARSQVAPSLLPDTPVPAAH